MFSEPYLISEWGSDYLEDAPVKLVERQMHGERTRPDEQVRLDAEPLVVTAETITMTVIVTIHVIVSNQNCKQRHQRHKSALAQMLCMLCMTKASTQRCNV